MCGDQRHDSLCDKFCYNQSIYKKICCDLYFCIFFFFFFSSRRRHTRCREVSWARRCVQETGINAEYMGIIKMQKKTAEKVMKDNKDKILFLYEKGLPSLMLLPVVEMLPVEMYSEPLVPFTSFQLIHFAATRGHTEVIAHLVRSGVPVDAIDHLGRSSLHFAASAGEVEAIKLLVSLGADVDLQTIGGDTALMKAVESRNWPAIKQLIGSNCNIYIKNNVIFHKLDINKENGYLLYLKNIQRKITYRKG
eukprot:TRINITY_DN2082_c0_g1_i2.p1 TRINITY_DN2082_c0_g1~~TRINITY_DN2082_c0_g1_i2.p1  ORF type:complete len:250 (+),score=56.02 TRINITY_DN2082_c0_g1_i2:25-774(+)